MNPISDSTNYVTVTMRAGTVEAFEVEAPRCEAQRNERCRLPAGHLGKGHLHWGTGFVTSWSDLTQPGHCPGNENCICLAGRSY